MNGVSSTTYSYDSCGVLKHINLPGSKWEKFYYDGLGRRIMVRRGDIEVVYQGRVLSFTPVDTGKYVYLGGSVIRELDNSPTPVVLKEYIRGLQLGGAIGRIAYHKKDPSFYYCHYNHMGDVCSLTDASQNLAAYYEYDAWGNTMTEAGTWNSPYRFSTKEWDDDSGLYYFGARYYSPEIGRWTQRDPAGTVDALNLYSYVNNSPPGLIDPLGLRAFDGKGRCNGRPESSPLRLYIFVPPDFYSRTAGVEIDYDHISRAIGECLNKACPIRYYRVAFRLGSLPKDSDWRGEVRECVFFFAVYGEIGMRRAVTGSDRMAVAGNWDTQITVPSDARGAWGAREAQVRYTNALLSDFLEGVGAAHIGPTDYEKVFKKGVKAGLRSDWCANLRRILKADKVD